LSSGTRAPPTKKLLVALAALIGMAGVGLAIFVGSRQHLTFNAPYPEVSASTDTTVVARGRYVGRSLANCWKCHGDPARHEEAMAGAEVPLSGGYEWDIPRGTFYPRNITPDSTTRIGTFSDGAIGRAQALC
jgi:mono/diheme cytochrome c family protein